MTAAPRPAAQEVLVAKPPRLAPRRAADLMRLAQLRGDGPEDAIMRHVADHEKVQLLQHVHDALVPLFAFLLACLAPEGNEASFARPTSAELLCSRWSDQQYKTKTQHIQENSEAQTVVCI